MRKRYAQTVTGLVPIEDMGVVMSHEHLFIDLNWPSPRETPATERAEYFVPVRLENHFEINRHHNNQDDRLFVDIDTAVKEAALFAASGGRTLVDATSVGLGRDPLALQRVATETGLHVIMGCGYYVNQFHPNSVAAATEDELADVITRDLTEGAADTGIKAGVIGEIGMSWPVHPDEVKVLRAAARAQRKTGAALLIHPGRHPDAPASHLATVAAAGGAPERTIIAHMDRTLFDANSIAKVLQSGCYVAFDHFGRESSFYPMGDIDMPNDAKRVDLIAELGDLGYLDRVLISQDVCCKTHLRSYGGHGYAHIIRNVVPIMERKGFYRDALDKLLIHNAAEALSLS